MKAKIKTTKEVDITTLLVDAGVRYWEDATVNGTEDEQGFFKQIEYNVLQICAVL